MAHKMNAMKATKAHAAAMKSYAKTVTDTKRGRALVAPKAKVIVTPRAKRGRSL